MAMIAIIADDLTGANDSGLQFSKYGLDTTVFLRDPAPELLAQATVAVMDTETRAMDAESVATVVADVATRVRSAGISHVYKKVDSTMRGHVGLELLTVAQHLDANIVLMTPAFPEMKRTVEDGQLLIDGIPVDQTALARDPTWPIRDSDLVRLLGHDRAAMRCISLKKAALEDWRTLQAALAAAGGSLVNGRICAVFDASTNEDLAALAVAGTVFAEQGHHKVLWAGSAGLAAHLPAAWGIPAEPPPDPALPPATRPPLLVLGSVSPVAIRQLAELVAETAALPVSMSPGLLLTASAERQAEIERACASLQSIIDQRRWPLILTTAHSREDVERTTGMARRGGLSAWEAGQRISSALAEVARTMLEKDAVNRLVTTGGDTSWAVMSAANISAVRVEGAIEAGIPVVTTRTGPRRHIVTKAGGFGSPWALIGAISFLTYGRLE